MAEVTLDGVRSAVRGGRRVIDGLDLRIDDGELLALLGGSGSGKSTLLRLIAGLDPLDGGRILIGDHDMAGVPTARRDIAMVIQDDALLPHLDARGNVGFSLRMRRLRKREVDRRVTAEARVMRISELLERRLDTLSAGQRQTTALARATVRASSLYLLDEPFARLDVHDRQRLRREIAQVVRWRGATAVLVTNDPIEAMAVGDRVAVLEQGRIAQVDTPQVLYARPASVATAQRVGDPPMTMLPGVLEPGRTTCWVQVGSQRVGVARPPEAVCAAYDGSAVLLGVRPEHAGLAAEGAPSLDGVLVHLEHLGAFALAHLALQGVEARLLARIPSSTDARAGDVLRVALDAEAVTLFDTGTGAALPHR